VCGVNDPTVNTPRISVVMPFLNVASFLEEAIESVLAQTYDRWELLLVDDGSTDGSTAIARRHVERDPRVHYLEHPGHANRGASASRNVAIRAARGDLVTFLDGDDVFVPTKLAAQVPIMDGTPGADATYAETLHWYSWTGRPEDRARDFAPDLGVPHHCLIRPPHLLLHMLTPAATVPALCSIVVRRTALHDVGMFEESFTHIFTDQALYAKLFLTKTVYVADGCWEWYRQHDRSSYMTVKRGRQGHATRLRFLLWLNTYLRARDVTDPQVRAAVRRAIRRSRYPGLMDAVGRARRLAGRVRRSLAG
jgi:glycosyltransferase involved in cell wall biosynthesis